MPTIRRSAQKHFTIPTNTKVNRMDIGDSIIANLNQNIMISCPFSGIPRPKIYWKFNGKSISKIKNVIITRNYSLGIRTAGWANTGEYECTASNAGGIDSVTSKVKIIGE